MKTPRILRILIPLLILAGVAGAWYWWRGHSSGADGKELTLYGNVDIREVQLAFPETEHINRMLVQEGDAVREDQLLATLDQELLSSAVDQAQAQVAAQEQVVKRLESGSRPEEIRQAQAQLDAARAEASQAQSSYVRTRELEAKKLASPQQLDDTRGAADTAAAKVKVAEETLALAVAGPREEDIEGARATLQALDAQLKIAVQHLADAQLRAPADGIIRNRILEPGDIASPDRPVYTLALTDPMWVRAYVSETDLGKVRPGMPAHVTTDTFPGKDYLGWVGYISPTSEFTPKSVETQELRTSLVYQVRVYVCNPQGELRLGMPATVHLEAGAAPGPAGTSREGHCGAQ
ncbi:MAG: efflux RND transporter periplasmic adaptor subunit [Arenicellales bacterium]